MRCTHCGVCCTETEMLLSKKDIARLQKKGFKSKFFMRYDKQGYVYLKNREGYCVFFDVPKQRCKVYSDRPAGCRIYPVILDEDVGIIFDNICRVGNTITRAEKNRKGARLRRLLTEIDAEAESRRLKLEKTI